MNLPKFIITIDGVLRMSMVTWLQQMLMLVDHAKSEVANSKQSSSTRSLSIVMMNLGSVITPLLLCRFPLSPYVSSPDCSYSYTSASLNLRIPYIQR